MKQWLALLLGTMMIVGTLLVLYNAKPNQPPGFYSWFIGIGVTFLMGLIWMFRRG